MERRVLGRGLGALITAEPENGKDTILLLDPRAIAPNRYQPRENFSDAALQELIDSIREKGLVQPLIVRQNDTGAYELIAGERRLRAVKSLNFAEVPVVVKTVSDREMLEMAIIENVQRQDLNPVEEANAYALLMEDFGFTQEQVAKTVGKNRATVANLLRILSLPEQIKQALAAGAISLGHAKALVSLPEQGAQLRLLEEIITHQATVREVEEYIAGGSSGAGDEPAEGADRRTQPRPAGKDAHVRQVEEELQQCFGTKVTIRHGNKRGKICIEYYSVEDLERILTMVRRTG
ncbi:MAG: ParB/RepB/Spo0J family partition protein [Candidatus Omnitrophica bacterium]|nr:ParB/RepB/Spo0J family partition protein [Candidatus Omnitrophota bacterium]